VGVAPGGPIPDSAFAALHRTLSGPGGFFDTDNLISNETSYLHVLGALRNRGVEGGAYLGVGPGQNFAYMAAVRPELAFIVDIRRDNVLQHLLYKALFELAPTRVEYLSLLAGVPAPPDPSKWMETPVQGIVAWADSAPRGPAPRRRAATRVDSVVATLGLPLSPGDSATIRRFHETFMEAGLDLRFTSFGRAPRPFYPTLRELLLARDLEGGQGSYLAREADYRFLRELQEKNRVIPVVGDLGGSHALPALADELRARGLTVSAFYVSNVEFYLARDGTFGRWARNVSALPRDRRSVLVRSIFSSFGPPHPHAVPGHGSTQSLQTLESFDRAMERGGYRSYRDLVTRDALDPRPRENRP
jgi:hypothetical protein